MLPLKKKICLISLVVIVVLSVVVKSAEAAKHVILMISDGAGYQAWLAASMYQGKVGKQTYDQPSWKKYSVTTYPLSLSPKPNGLLDQDKALIYDPAKAWDESRSKSLFGKCKGYDYLKATATDSAAAATAMATGRKTYNHAINWSNDNKPMIGETIAELAKAKGKSVGVVTSVQWSHATPAALGGAHNVHRDHYAEIANEMLDAPWLDVIMGSGNPDFDNNGRMRTPKKSDYDFVGGMETWTLLKQGKHPSGWKLIESKEDFEKLAEGSTSPPVKLLGVPQVAKTLQENRNSDPDSDLVPDEDRKDPVPFHTPFNQNVPTLAVMSKAAMHTLEKNPQGFYLMIEGGAVDWANHANDKSRLIEEQIDFVKTVETVVEWIEKNSNWDETLLILTADHESGLLIGPSSSRVAFQHLEDFGEGQLPGMSYHSTNHSNSLVPLYARGADAEILGKLLKGKDEKAAAFWNISGDYLDNTDIFTVMKAAIEAHEKP